MRFKKENIHLFGVWFDSEKPNMTTLLTSLVQMFINAWYSGSFHIIINNLIIIGIDIITCKGEKIHTTALLLAGIFHLINNLLISDNGFKSQSSCPTI